MYKDSLDGHFVELLPPNTKITNDAASNKDENKEYDNKVIKEVFSVKNKNRKLIG